MYSSRQKTQYKRVLLKLSGESLAGEMQIGIDPKTLNYFVKEVKNAISDGIQLAVVIGGGNIFRGLSADATKMDRVTADQMGMLATIINALALKDAFLQNGIKATVMSAVQMDEFAELFIKSNAIDRLQKGHVIVFGAGTGNPYFTTDTAAVLRAIEIEADVILKGTRVDGVYDSDPEKNKDSKLFSELSYMDVINDKLKVMDTTAITLAMDNNLPIIVFNFNNAGNLKKVINGEHIGSKVQG